MPDIVKRLSGYAALLCTIPASSLLVEAPPPSLRTLCPESARQTELERSDAATCVEPEVAGALP